MCATRAYSVNKAIETASPIRALSRPRAATKRQITEHLIDRALTAAKKSDRPTMIACKTHIALGHAAQDTSKGHGALTDKAQLQAAKDAYGWTGGSFEIPAKIKAEWEAMGTRGAKSHAEWSARVAALSAAKQAELIRIVALPDVQAKLRGLGSPNCSLTAALSVSTSASGLTSFCTLRDTSAARPMPSPAGPSTAMIMWRA